MDDGSGLPNLMTTSSEEGKVRSHCRRCRATISGLTADLQRFNRRTATWVCCLSLDTAHPCTQPDWVGKMQL